MKITENELLDALRVAQLTPTHDPSGALTSHEIGDAMGISHATVIVYLKRLKKAGRIEVVRAPREGLDGRVSPTTAYRVLPAPKGKRAA